MLNLLIQGFMLGLATGSTCLLTCTPIYIPYMLSDGKSIGKSFWKVMEISAGRFFSYLAFGAMAGFAGSKISSMDRTWFTSVSYILIAGYLILTALRTYKSAKKCHVPKLAMVTKSAFLLGIITGINFCPSFLLAVSRAIDVGGALNGVWLFLGFFFGTSIFLLPLALVGGFSKVKEMKIIAQVASLIVALVFLGLGVKDIYVNSKNIINKKEVVSELKTVPRLDVFAPNQILKIICEKDNVQYFVALRDSIISFHTGTVEIEFSDQYQVKDSDVLFVDKSSYVNLKENFANNHKLIVSPGYDIPLIINHLKTHIFAVRKPLEWRYEFEE